MAWAFVSGAATKTKTVTKSVTTGNLLICGFVGGDGTTTPTISDGVNTWTAASASPIKDATNGNTVAMWWAVAATTASITITITDTPTTFNGTCVAEYSGNAASSLGDGSAGTANIAGSTATDGQATGSFSTAVDGDLIVSFMADDGNSPVVTQFTAGTGYTKRTTCSQDPGGATDMTYALEDLVQSTHGSINPTWTCASSQKSVGLSAAFKVLGGGGATNIPIVLAGYGGGFVGDSRGWAG